MSIMQGSTESGDLNPQQFKQSQPIMLQKKHQTAMNQVKELQELEKYLFKNLQNVNKSDQDSQAQEAAIRTRINELKTMRMNLFDKLKHLYTDAQDRVNINRRDLADQIAVSKTMEDELENTEDTLRQLEAEKNSKMRLIKIGEWEYDRYYETKEIVKRLVYMVFISLLILFAMRTPYVKPWIGVLALAINVSLFLIIIAKRVAWNMRRDHHDYDKFIQTYDKSVFEEGKDAGKVVKKGKLSDLLGLANCKNAAYLSEQSKNYVKSTAAAASDNYSAEAEASGADMSEGYENIQPIESIGKNSFSYLY